MFRRSIMAMLVNRDPIYCLPIFIRQVRVSFVMLHMNALVENLAKPDRDRLQNAKQTVQNRGTKIRVVNEIVGDAINVPRNADRVDEPEYQHEWKRNAGEKVKHPKEISAMQ